MSNDERQIREFETSILDKAHLSYSIFDIPSVVSIPHFLKAYGDAERNSYEDSLYPESTKRRVLHQLLLAISQCIKWVQSNSKADGKTDNTSLKQIQNECGELIKWAYEYSAISQQFTAWSRGELKMTVDLIKKEIRTVPVSKEIIYSYHVQQENSEYYLDKTFDSILTEEKYQETFSSWAKEYNISTPPIAAHIDWSRAIKSSLFKQIYSEMEKIVLPELDTNTNLGGYTRGDFLVFFSSLFINFHFICSYEQWLDLNAPDIAQKFGSNPIGLPANTMISFLMNVTQLNEQPIKAILQDLTLDLDNFHSNLMTQPIVLNSNDEYIILPNLFAYINPNRMISGALNKSKEKRKIYSRLITLIEKKNIDKIFLYLQGNTNFDVYNRKFKVIDTSISPDFILINKRKNELLIVDYKHFLPPINASETTYRMSEIQKGFDQINRYECFFQNNVKVTEELGLFGNFKIFKLLLCRYPSPVPLKVKEIVLTDLLSFKNAINTIKSFSELEIVLAKSKEDHLSKEDFNPFEFATPVQDWKFIRTAYLAGADTDS